MRKYLDIPITLIVTLTLTVAMLWPLEAPPPAPDGSDKVVHLIAFAALSFPLARTGRFGLFPVFMGASAFGGLIELIQPSFNRSFDMKDWVADVMGGLSIRCRCSIHAVPNEGSFLWKKSKSGKDVRYREVILVSIPPW